MSRSVNCAAAIADARDSKQASEAFHALFADRDKAELARLLADDNLSISLRGKWLECAGDVRERSSVLAPGRFIGFFEGRVGISAPDYWTATVAWKLADLSAQVREALNNDLLAGQKQRLALTDTRNIATIHFDDEAVTIELGAGTEGVDKFVSSDASFLEFVKARHRSINVAAIHRADMWLVAIYRGFDNGCHFPLFGFRSDGTLLWKSVVWADGREKVTSAAGASSAHEVILATNARSVIVFGICGHRRAYSEGFALRDGVSEFRFTTGDWHFNAPKVFTSHVKTPWYDNSEK